MEIENIFIEEDVEDINYIEYENQEIRSRFNLEEVLSFQMEHVVQVIRGEDFQFNCWIDNKCYANSLTFLHSLVTGIHQFRNKIKNV